MALRPASLISAATLTLLISLWATAGAADLTPPVRWDPDASEELKQELHRMHEIWNQGDMLSLKKIVKGDDVLVTFELDPETHQPLRLNSGSELHAWMDSMSTDLDDRTLSNRLDHPMLNCRATDSFGVCTEECSVWVTLKDGKEEHHKLFSTAVAVKESGRWVWIQWHMSVANQRHVHEVKGVHQVAGAEVKVN